MSLYYAETEEDSDQSIEQHFAVQALKSLFPSARFYAQYKNEMTLWYIISSANTGALVEVRIARDGTTAIYT